MLLFETLVDKLVGSSGFYSRYMTATLRTTIFITLILTNALRIAVNGAFDVVV